jgi:hypothetical protein
MAESKAVSRHVSHTSPDRTCDARRQAGNPICRQIPWGEGRQYDERLQVRSGNAAQRIRI